MSAAATLAAKATATAPSRPTAGIWRFIGPSLVRQYVGSADSQGDVLQPDDRSWVLAESNLWPHFAGGRAGQRGERGVEAAAQLRALPLFSVTAARTRAFSASSSILSPSWKSMARLVFPSRLELKRRDG